MHLLMKWPTTIYSPTKGIQHEFDQASGSCCQLQDIQRGGEHAELQHSYVISKIRTLGHCGTNAPGSSTGKL